MRTSNHLFFGSVGNEGKARNDFETKLFFALGALRKFLVSPKLDFFFSVRPLILISQDRND